VQYWDSKGRYLYKVTLFVMRVLRVVLETLFIPEPTVISVAVEPKAKRDDGKASEGFAVSLKKDPTFRVMRPTQKPIKRLFLVWVGTAQQKFLVDRMKREFAVGKLTWGTSR
jgi:translation elongation factor EF-G